jgi:hypothetical protein
MKSESNINQVHDLFSHQILFIVQQILFQF